MGFSNNSVNPDMNTITSDDNANQIVTKLNEQANSMTVKITIKTNQNQGVKINSYMSISASFPIICYKHPMGYSI